MRTRKLVTIAILSSIAIVLSILESFIPTGIPGVKLGLANAVTMIVLYLYSEKEASLVLLLRIFLVGLIYSGILSISFFLSLVGGLLSLIVMILIYRIKRDSLYFMSVMGSIFHALGQILVAYIYIKDSSIIYYLPFMLALSIPCGIITASVTSLVLKTFKNEIIKPNRISLSILLGIFVISLIISIVFLSYQKRSDEGTVASITHQNKLITEIPLSNPEKYKEYTNDLIETKKDGDSYLFIYKVYNNDEKDYFTLTIEVVNEKIRIKEETCKKHICSRRGYISSKYESLICLPNSFVVSLNDMKLSEIDLIM